MISTHTLNKASLSNTFPSPLAPLQTPLPKHSPRSRSLPSYPTSAMRRRVRVDERPYTLDEGVHGFSLMISLWGRVTQCSVDKASDETKREKEQAGIGTY